MQDDRRHLDAPLRNRTDLGEEATKDISGALRTLLADTFALYLKTKNFHWHMSGPHFRDYHLMLDDHASQLFAMTDQIAERSRKIGGAALRSISHIGQLQRLLYNDAEFVTPQDMVAELASDNRQFVSYLRSVHGVAEEYNDIATTSLIEVWIDQSEQRAWFLFETTRSAEGGHL